MYNQCTFRIPRYLKKIYVKTTIRIRNVFRNVSEKGKKKKNQLVFLERNYIGRNHRDVKSRATSRAKLRSIGRLASSMKVSDISSMVRTTRERGVSCHRQLAIIYFAVSRMKTSGAHTIDDDDDDDVLASPIHELFNRKYYRMMYR